MGRDLDLKSVDVESQELLNLCDELLLCLYTLFAARVSIAPFADSVSGHTAEGVLLLKSIHLFYCG